MERKVTDGASDIISLYEMPTDAYTALKALVPDHELCLMYEEEWFAEGPKPKIAARFASEATSVAKVILNFTDAMIAAAKLAKMPPGTVVVAKEATPPVAEKLRKSKKLPPSDPINW